ncbi:hypothetical protein Tco_0065318 [Tanacetum coccineum]
MQSSSSLHEWRQYQRCYDNSKLQECCDVICKPEETLNLPKIKNIPKAIDLVQAMYGLKVQTMFIFSIFVAAFSSSLKPLVDMQVPKEYLWQASFTVLQVSVNIVKSRTYMLQGSFLLIVLVDRKNNVKFLTGLDELKSEMDCFFKVVVSARMALLDNFQEQPPRSSVQQVRM